MKKLSTFLLLLLLLHRAGAVLPRRAGGRDGRAFIRTRGLHFMLNGNPFFANGFNAYWLMTVASDPSQRPKVSSAFHQASSHGLTVARTWAFSDGGNATAALQYAPGSYNERIFQGLDFVVAEAGRYGIRLILSLANNYDDFGGKKQYVQWARDRGQGNISSKDHFFTNALVKDFYKNHVQTVLTRMNTVTGIAYRDDPTIFAWELMNEPRCQSDLSGRTIQAWIKEMAAHVKSIDSNHLLEAGLEGFYASPSSQANAGLQVGTDFIPNNQIHGIDFASLHLYPDLWLHSSNDLTQMSFLNSSLDIHIRHAGSVIGKPLLITEFGKSCKDPGYSSLQRDQVLNNVYTKVYLSARTGGAAAGALFWQLFSDGLDFVGDGYEIILDKAPSTSRIISAQCRRLGYLGKMYSRGKQWQDIGN